MHKVSSLKELKDLCQGPACLAIGMFDGVHLGHQTVIGELVAQARSIGGKAVVMTFWPHPAKVLSGNSDTKPMLMASDIRKQAIQYMGVDILVEIPFTHDFAHISATDFLDQLTQALPELKSIYVGDNFQFGHKRQGNVKLLEQYSQDKGFKLEQVNPVLYHGETISSTAIRDLMTTGDLEKANAFLGYNYYSHATITADNSIQVEWIGEITLPCGQYGVSLNFGQHKEFFTTGLFDSVTLRLEIADPKLLSHSKSVQIQLSWLHAFKGTPQESKLANWVSWHEAGGH